MADSSVVTYAESTESEVASEVIASRPSDGYLASVAFVVVHARSIW